MDQNFILSTYKFKKKIKNSIDNWYGWEVQEWKPSKPTCLIVMNKILNDHLFSWRDQ